jgi:hypothetical protein
MALSSVSHPKRSSRADLPPRSLELRCLEIVVIVLTQTSYEKQHLGNVGCHTSPKPQSIWEASCPEVSPPVEEGGQVLKMERKTREGNWNRSREVNWRKGLLVVIPTWGKWSKCELPARHWHFLTSPHSED